MKFDPKSQNLYSDAGEILKTLNCPLDKNWDALVFDNSTPLKRYCNSCDTHVIDITEFSEPQVVDLLKIDADSCFCIRRDSSQIKWLDEGNRINPRRIPTCFGVTMKVGYFLPNIFQGFCKIEFAQNRSKKYFIRILQNGN